MTNEIEISGFKFAVEGFGFVRAQAEGDFERIAALVGAYLAALETAELGRLHAGATFGDEGATDEAVFDELNLIASSACHYVTRNWHDPSGAFVTISSISARTPAALAVGTYLKAAGFDRAYALNGIRSYCSRFCCNRDPQTAWDRAVAKGHATAWCINSGIALVDHDNSDDLAKERADFASALVVKTGDVFIIEGVAQRCQVNGARYSDPIVFYPVA